MVCKSSDCQVISDGKIGTIMGERENRNLCKGF